MVKGYGNCIKGNIDSLVQMVDLDKLIKKKCVMITSSIEIELDIV